MAVFRHLKRIAYFNFSIFSLFVLIIIKFFSTKKTNPTTFIFSLSKQQVFYDSNPKDLISILSEHRFQEFFSLENAIWEVRSLRAPFQRNPDFTLDTSIYLFLHCLTWRSSFRAGRMCLIRLNSIFRTSDEFDIKEIKRLCFDKSIWDCTFQEARSPIQLVTTLNSWNKFPICFNEEYSPHTFRIMLWYSNNSFQIRRKGMSSVEPNPVEKIGNQIDLHLVWSKSQMDLLESLNLSKSCVVGPIHLQANSGKEIHPFKEKKLNVTFFDVLPIPKYEEFSYYTSRSAKQNLEVSLHVLSRFAEKTGQELTFMLKPKRLYKARYHDDSYQDFVTALERMGKIKVLSPRVNLYDVLSYSNIVLGVPYTSPVQLARSLGKLSIFVAFNSSDWDFPEELDGIKVVQDSETLEILLSSLEG